VKITLQKGWNALLIKVTQDTGSWEFCFAVRTPDGGELEGLKVQASKPAE